MKKGWKIAAVGLIILLLFLDFFKECLWEWYDDIMEPRRATLKRYIAQV